MVDHEDHFGLHGDEMLKRLITALAAAVLLVASATAASARDHPPAGTGTGSTSCNTVICTVVAERPGTGGNQTTSGNHLGGGLTGDASNHGGGNHTGGGGPVTPPPPLCTQNSSGPCTPPCTGDGLVAGGLGATCTPPPPGTPITPGPPPPNPAVVAQHAVDNLSYPPPLIGIVPEPGPHKMGLVGLPIYMWTRDRTWGTATATATAGTVVETAHAKVTRVVWSMGNGDEVTCTTPGTVYEDSFGAASSPDCGYTYVKPGEYDVTATATYGITWTGPNSGSDTKTRSSTVHIRVGEMQAINQ